MPLSIRLMWRTLRGPEGWLAILTVFSIGSSVALTTALEMSSRSAGLQVERTAQAMTGSAKIEISAGSVGIAERVLGEVLAEQGVLAASPMISAKLGLADQRFALNIVGLDLLADEQVRPNSVSRHGVQIRDPLRLLAQSNSVVVTQRLLERLGLSPAWEHGEAPVVRVRSAGAESELTVQGLLDPIGVAAAFGGQVAVMDIYALQKLTHREGWFDRIDVVPAPNADIDALSARLSARLDGVATVRRSRLRTQFLDEVVYILRVFVLVIAGAGIVVSGLLTYASMTQWVDHQRHQLATLRAVGMEAGRVERRVFLEANLLAVIGTAIGIGSGLVLARPVLAAISAYSIFPAGEDFVDLSVQPFTFLLAILVGISCAVSGSIVPARRAGRRFALDAFDRELDSGAKPSRLGLVASPSVVLLIIAISSHLLLERGAIVRLSALFAASLVSMISLTSIYPRLLRALTGGIQKVYPQLSNLVGRAFCARPLSFAVAVTAFSGLIAALICVALTLASMEGASDDWINARFPDATYITAGPPADGERRELLTPETMRAIRATPGVSAVDEQYWFGRTMLYRGEEVPIIAQTMSVVAEHGNITSVGQPAKDLGRTLIQGGVAVSLQFARRFGVDVGNSIKLDTAEGPILLRVEGLFKDFGGTTGLIVMDIGTFDAHWSRTGAWGAVVWIDGDRDAVIESIRERTGRAQDLFFTDSAELRRLNREQLARLTGVVSAVGGLLALLGGFSVTILMVGVIAERRRDFAVLRAAGFEPAALARLVLADATVIAVFASVFGIAISIVCARPSTDILRETYGWIVEQRWFAEGIPWIVLGAFASAILGGLVPAYIAYRTGPTDLLAPE
jgi:putative ABC transport system permease protein